VNTVYPAGGFAWPIVESTGSTCPWNELIVARIRCSRSSWALELRSAMNPATSPPITTPRMLRITSQNSRLASSVLDGLIDGLGPGGDGLSTPPFALAFDRHVGST
jgi:hypothetical protein